MQANTSFVIMPSTAKKLCMRVRMEIHKTRAARNIQLATVVAKSERSFFAIVSVNYETP